MLLLVKKLIKQVVKVSLMFVKEISLIKIVVISGKIAKFRFLKTYFFCLISINLN